MRIDLLASAFKTDVLISQTFLPINEAIRNWQVKHPNRQVIGMDLSSNVIDGVPYDSVLIAYQGE